VIIGENGVGKSSIVEAITYALFGQTRAKADDELSYGYDNRTKQWRVDKFSVRLKFELKGSIFEVVRGKSPSNTSLKFGRNGEWGHTGNTIKETEAKIQKIIGVNYDSFVASTVLKQNEYDDLMEMSPSHSKEILMNIMGLDHFEEKEKVAKERYDKAQIELGIAANKFDTVKAEYDQVKNVEAYLGDAESALKILKEQKEIHEKNIEKLRTQYQEVKQKHDRQAEFFQQKLELEAKHKDIQRKIRDKENAFDKALGEAGIELKELLENREKLPGWESQLNEKQSILYQSHNTAEKEKTGAEFSVSRLKEDIAKARKKLDGNHNVCLMAKDECNLQWKENIQKDIDLLEANLIHHNTINVSAKMAVEEALNKMNDNTARLKKIRNARTAILMYDAMKEVKDQADELYNQKEAAVSRVQEAQVTDDDVRGFELQIRSHKELLNETNTKISDTEREIGKYNALKEKKEELFTAGKALKVKKKELLEEVNEYAILQKAFSKDGIPALMIENAVPRIEDDANEMLSKMTQGRISLEFRLQKKLKGGGFSDSFEIFVTDEKGTRSARMFSGGEKFRVVFAIHAALSSHLAKRTGANIRFLFIDEPSGLDQQGLDKLVEVLGSLQERYEQILVISHLRELIDYFPQTFYVQKTLAGSKVQSKEKLDLDEYL
jgi:exonuclease SbcC